MGFGGSAQAMITTLKNNEKMRSNRKKFKKTLGGYGKTGKVEYDFPKATPKQLRELRQRLKKENKMMWLKVTVVSMLVISFLIWMLLL
ncbi:hypothetical protein [uncultured Winogradskyella sp.]|uniref:hypothetical protein n=1 Tax=uncultured Winogradskyella sp. TaxID=395353 RepID=UPI00260BF14D|nr:hypothetical protein [uncultured Winogradskyella sp.]